MWLGYGNCFEAPFFYSVYGNPIRTDVLIASLAESLDPLRQISTTTALGRGRVRRVWVNESVPTNLVRDNIPVTAECVHDQ
jgi:hypothetical protein